MVETITHRVVCETTNDSEAWQIVVAHNALDPIQTREDWLSAKAS